MADRLSKQKDRIALQQLRQRLVSVAGLVGSPVLLKDGSAAGAVVDLVCKWNQEEAYPLITGLVMRVGQRRSWVAADSIAEITREEVKLGTGKLDLRDFAPREGEVRLMKEVVDHQLIDVNGVRVVRAGDLYVSRVGNRYRMVGVDTGIKTLLRRLGPARLRATPAPTSVINWADVQGFGQSTTTRGIQTSAPMRELRRLRAGELADLLEDLGREERQELLEALGPEHAADALEEMQPDELESLLRESHLDDAAELVAHMEPDEAADALRDFSEPERSELMQAIPKEEAERIAKVLEFQENQAGGLMTTSLLTAKTTETVVEVQQRLKQDERGVFEIGAVSVVDDAGVLIDDVAFGELFVAGPEQPLRELVGLPLPVTVPPTASLDEVVELLIANRNSSIVVVDEQGRPLGRILADDIIDALQPERGRFHFPRIFE